MPCADGKVPSELVSESRTKRERYYLPQISQRRGYSTTLNRRQAAEAPTFKDYVIIGGGPVGASTAWFLTENGHADKEVVLVHDPKNKGAHEDWSRLARLSFDGPVEEMNLSRLCHRTHRSNG